MAGTYSPHGRSGCFHKHLIPTTGLRTRPKHERVYPVIALLAPVVVVVVVVVVACRVLKDYKRSSWMDGWMDKSYPTTPMQEKRSI